MINFVVSFSFFSLINNFPIDITFVCVNYFVFSVQPTTVKTEIHDIPTKKKNQLLHPLSAAYCAFSTLLLPKNTTTTTKTTTVTNTTTFSTTIQSLYTTHISRNNSIQHLL